MFVYKLFKYFSRTASATAASSTAIPVIKQLSFYFTMVQLIFCLPIEWKMVIPFVGNSLAPFIKSPTSPTIES